MPVRGGRFGIVGNSEKCSLVDTCLLGRCIDGEGVDARNRVPSEFRDRLIRRLAFSVVLHLVISPRPPSSRTHQPPPLAPTCPCSPRQLLQDDSKRLELYALPAVPSLPAKLETLGDASTSRSGHEEPMMLGDLPQAETFSRKSFNPRACRTPGSLSRTRDGRRRWNNELHDATKLLVHTRLSGEAILTSRFGACRPPRSMLVVRVARVVGSDVVRWCPETKGQDLSRLRKRNEHLLPALCPTSTWEMHGSSWRPDNLHAFLRSTSRESDELFRLDSRARVFLLAASDHAEHVAASELAQPGRFPLVVQLAQLGLDACRAKLVLEAGEGKRISFFRGEGLGDGG